MIANEAPHQSQLEMETKDLILLRLIKQADERHIETTMKFQMSYDQQKLFSEQQVSMVLELRKELEALKLQMSSMDVGKQLVKATNKIVKSAQIEATTKQKGQIQDRSPIKLDQPELHSSYSSTTDGDKIPESNSCLKKSEFNSHSSSTSAAIGRSIVTTKQPIRLGITKSSSPSDVIVADTSPVHFALTAKVEGNPDKKKHSGHWDADTSSIQGSEEQDTSARYNPKNSGRNRFRVSSAPKDECQAACNRIQKALNKVPTKVSWDFNGDRTHCDLYVGNLDFNANRDDLFESLRPYFGRVHVENVSIPSGKGSRNREYGFIALSWARDSPVDPADICSMLSGRIKVNSRPIYLCETEDSSDSNSNGSNDTSTASSAASDNSESGRDTSTASSAASDNSESGRDTSTASPAASEPSESEFIQNCKAFLTRINSMPSTGRCMQWNDSDGDSIYSV